MVNDYTRLEGYAKRIYKQYTWHFRWHRGPAINNNQQFIVFVIVLILIKDCMYCTA